MDWSKLRRQISELFSSSELRELCFDLDIPYHDLPGDTLTEKAIELIEYCRRHERVSDLLEYCQKGRPAVTWPLVATEISSGVKPVASSPLHDVAFEKGSIIEQVKDRLEKLHTQYDKGQDEVMPVNLLLSELRGLFNRHSFDESLDDCKDRNWHDRLCAVVQTSIILGRYWGYVKDSATQAGNDQILGSFEEVQSLVRNYGQTMTGLFEPPPPRSETLKEICLMAKSRTGELNFGQKALIRLIELTMN